MILAILSLNPWRRVVWRQIWAISHDAATSVAASFFPLQPSSLFDFFFVTTRLKYRVTLK